MAFKPKVGLISCSGEACSGGNISRAATLEVLHYLRPTETVTICLPLFLAGDEGEREFARSFPTITIDGCSKLCAARGTERYSSTPAMKMNLEEYLGESCTSTDERWRLERSSELVDRIAQDIASHVNRLREEWG
ncbi:MAG: putative zinc-binding protein [Candidatus Thorarchaeota archaeon]|nr:MAG: putative zinc-binding protein [Candidatus Thorarchaeota archaeon]